jgi:hypothetical protein
VPSKVNSHGSVKDHVDRGKAACGDPGTLCVTAHFGTAEDGRAIVWDTPRAIDCGVLLVGY